jgi:hypothetical protein
VYAYISRLHTYISKSPLAISILAYILFVSIAILFSRSYVSSYIDKQKMSKKKKEKKKRNLNYKTFLFINGSGMVVVFLYHAIRYIVKKRGTQSQQRYQVSSSPPLVPSTVSSIVPSTVPSVSPKLPIVNSVSSYQNKGQNWARADELSKHNGTTTSVNRPVVQNTTLPFREVKKSNRLSGLNKSNISNISNGPNGPNKKRFLRRESVYPDIPRF